MNSIIDFKNKKYCVVTYGCQMNLHESEKISGILSGMGMSAVNEPENADVVVFNTCCIRDTAERRALGNIGKMKELKKKNKNLLIVVTGCMTQQNGFAENMKERYQYVDVILGTHNISDLENQIRIRLEKKKRVAAVLDTDGYIDDETTPVTRTSFPNAWVNINYGCNNFCTYCIVPYVRGRERSRDMKSIISECEKLINDGYKEITLLGQNVNSYGNDVPDENVNFANLLREVAKIDGKFRIRFMTSHPKDLTEDVVKAIRDNDKICNNIHLPIQAGSNSVLKNMNRRYTREHYLGLIDMIRRYLPDCGITTDIMVGFPYETEEDFLDTMDIVEKVRFSTAFTFIYSVRKGTKAAEMPQIPYEIKQNRIKRLIARQNEITEEISKDYVGNVYEILVEGMQEKKNGYVVGRTESGRLVSAKGDESMIGEFKNVKITAVKNAQLLGEIL
ncbi:MAG: tRNA (N6-isopentenyl adenosine(37)-C2)-methylthiotransferase MiaB [Clostridiales bacterium]|jgi:tRNA-i(6)A37 thiotransferase enzyme miaB|nr:tRNA (N6-isopentenyl adenosine(37)-C2)-methylthiotransferase MiaB [Clostridiales bacterium]MDY2971572.1 tRNA (N6-isopentenyl adenosine(37)-C2)-methylthiotransferase MiaB [Eubacteriales bacterium]MCI6183327.1 tRNA (N6-isopentenyl adenosine(37)-C2)-methylthiotransferase MiaB [Clostridiales bacterium]MCI6945926.1 tRNA (N6-isopentenyl adenosine(37)-C2)-methylthiotransferase MiaB [Clostridiales bacterium]MCI6976445.1 tRNA (N6-isopentenyl adenosine(37)-C2)-methylthiotransferase MiaB [Clostridiales